MLPTFRHLLLVVLLLFAQAGALAHGVTHLGLHDQHAPGHEPVCEQCLAFAPMGAGATASPPLWQAPAATFRVAVQPLPASTSGFRPIYQSRAPPRTC